ncbi:MAG: hypothetical protein ACLU6Y_03620 [Ruminococcus sp.]
MRCNHLGSLPCLQSYLRDRFVQLVLDELSKDYVAGAKARGVRIFCHAVEKH